MSIIEMRQITKRFPGIIANDHIDLTVKKGEIHALLGENGAGKSTLMSILFGLYQPDEGEIYISGKRVHIDGPNEANRLGIGMVHQHFMLVKPFTVTENIILGMEPSKGFKIDMNQARARVKELSEKYGLKIDPDAKIADISVGMQQRVEIIKTLYRGAEILIFDEPTAVLTPQEIDDLLVIMKNLVDEGKSIVFITHKLKEIMRVCDRVTVIRRGKVVESLYVADTDADTLAMKMVGREVKLAVEKKPSEQGKKVLQIQKLDVKDTRGFMKVRGLELDVYQGEILGLAGVEGNGQSELIEAITGLRPVSGGTVILNGKPITGFSPRKVIESCVSHIPEDRHHHGLVLDFNIAENMVLETYRDAPFAKGLILQQNEIVRHAERLIEDYDVRTPSAFTPARALSGGNQQKAIIAREVDRDPDLLIAAQPTRGLDVGAIEFIHKRLIEQRNKGKAVLLVSLELDEIMRLSDRIAVIYNGQIVGIVKPEETSDRELGVMMAGASDQNQQSVEE